MKMFSKKHSEALMPTGYRQSEVKMDA